MMQNSRHNTHTYTSMRITINFKYLTAAKLNQKARLQNKVWFPNFDMYCSNVHLCVKKYHQKWVICVISSLTSLSFSAKPIPKGLVNFNFFLNHSGSRNMFSFVWAMQIGEKWQHSNILLCGRSARQEFTTLKESSPSTSSTMPIISSVELVH